MSGTAETEFATKLSEHPDQSGHPGDSRPDKQHLLPRHSGLESVDREIENGV